MAQPGLNFERARLAHRVGPILSPLMTREERKGEIKLFYFYFFLNKNFGDQLDNHIWFFFIYLTGYIYDQTDKIHDPKYKIILN